MSTAYNPGLDAVIVARTEISEVDGHRGRLIYRGGYYIEDIFDRPFEEIAYLLWFGSFPADDELRRFSAALAGQRELSTAARSALAGLPPDVDPTDGLRTLLSAHGAGVASQSPAVTDAIALTAVTATAIAAFYRRRHGQDLVEPRADLSHAENFLYMLTGSEPPPEQARLLQVYLAIMADHALSPSTFTAQVVGSTGSDLWSAVIAALAALKGPAHGGAIAAATRMLEEVGNADNAESFVLDVLESNGRLMGFGHREYREYDPRARILREVCKSVNPDFYEKAEAVERVALRELLNRHPDRPNQTNVDFYAGGILLGLGFPPEFFVCIFAAARVVGWSAHVIEYVTGDNRIVSPASEWTGPPARQRSGEITW